MQKYIANHFKGLLSPSLVLKYSILIFAIWSLIGTYNTMYKTYDRLTPLAVVDFALPHNSFEVDSKTFQEEYNNFMAQKTLSGPIALLYEVLPYYKLQLSMFYSSENELTGYFEVPTGKELLSLNTENIYKPKLPIPKRQDISINKLSDPNYLIQHFITGDAELEIGKELLNLWNFKDLAKNKIQIDETAKGPKILIFHTHVKERYADEKKGAKGVIAVGDRLAEILEKDYQIETLHVTDSFYISEESESVEGAYERMQPVIMNILKQYPSIQMCIDIHRDGVSGNAKFLTALNGKDTAKIMFVNGLCLRRDAESNILPMQELTNPYIEENLALSMQMQIQGLKYYPTLMRKIYLKPYRYSLHMKPLSLVVEVGNQNNTLQEAVSSAEPLAHILAKVLEKD